ncbi:MAG: hypothetical protein IPK20_00480 [Betaproteobacteria bacterium]|nr:hypothetical protein [Betaproteobacteria bacterium]
MTCIGDFEGERVGWFRGFLRVSGEDLVYEKWTSPSEEKIYQKLVENPQWSVNVKVAPGTELGVAMLKTF